MHFTSEWAQTDPSVSPVHHGWTCAQQLKVLHALSDVDQVMRVSIFFSLDMDFPQGFPWIRTHVSACPKHSVVSAGPSYQNHHWCVEVSWSFAMARLTSSIKARVFLSDFAAAFVVQRLRKLRSSSLLLSSSFASTADIGKLVLAPLTADR